MALYQRGRIWYADYYANGERIQESTGTANKREAEKILALRISEVQRGVFVKPVNVTLPEFGEKYIEYAKLHKRSWKRDVQMLGNLQTFFGPCKLRDITPLRIEEYPQARLKQDGPGDIKPRVGFAQAHVFCCGAVGTTSGHQSGAAGEIPTGKQPPFFNSQ